MNKFILVTFALLGWVFYEMSGGADFVPETRSTAQAATPETGTPEAEGAEVALAEETVTGGAEVTRASAIEVNTAGLLTPASAPAAQPQVEATTATAIEALVEEVAADEAEAAILPRADVGGEAGQTLEFTSLANYGNTDNIEVATTPAQPLDIRQVAGTRVNMRQGPGTDFGVIDTLPGGTQAEVLEVAANGWARIRIIDSGAEGWMAERLLTDG